jgi:pimeloyl-ACP methyl ester carboxylesterase
MTDHTEIIGPVSSYYVSQRLRLHFVDWGNPQKPPLLLVHGGRDHARSWDWVARALRDDYHVIAPDLRGHGDSEWARGGHYMIQEFVLDIAQLLNALDLGPVTLVGHSLGGVVVTNYTSVYPDRVHKLVNIEGLGPPPELLEGHLSRPAWERTSRWIDQVREFSSKRPKHYRSIADAAQRMRDANSFLSAEQAEHLTIHGVARNEDGSFSWKFDNYVRLFYPQRHDIEEMHAMWGRITCPTLLILGEQSNFGNPMEDGRFDAFENAQFENVANAGHWVHHDQLDHFVSLLRNFLG